MKKYGVEWFSQSKEFKNKIQKIMKEKRYSLFQNQLKLKHLELLLSKEEYINSDTFIFKCSRCNNIFNSKATNIQMISCSCVKNKPFSEKELNVKKWISSIIEDEIVQNDRSELNGKELDIFIPSHKLAIEFDGIYWHSELFKDKDYHLNKTLECEKNGIQLIHIFENEWDNKQDIVKSIILSKLGIFERKIPARKCVIKEISNAVYEEFCELNHIQGYSVSKTKLGLFFENELVQIASFGKSRFKKGETELIRSCSLLNTQVIGGFDKLVQCFIKEYSPEILISYVDRRYFDGHGYKNWKLVSETKPNYWYWRHDEVFSRIQFQKHKLSKLLENYNPNLTEVENMTENGFLRIWDCGNLKFQYNF